MKYILFPFLLLFAANLCAQENYIIQLGDKNYSMALDSASEVTYQGKKLKLLLKQKDTLVYKDTSFSFSYLKGYEVSKTLIDDVANQYIVIDAGGSGFIIQKFWSMNPTPMKEVLLQEMTKESKGYGFVEKRDEYERTLKTGQTVKVIKSTLTYKDEVNIYEVAAFGGKDEGIVIIAVDMGGDYARKGRELSKLMWKSIQYF
jgi:hypothetical protein